MSLICYASVISTTVVVVVVKIKFARLPPPSTPMQGAGALSVSDIEPFLCLGLKIGLFPNSNQCFENVSSDKWEYELD